MNVTESRFKNRQLHIEDYLQMVSAEQKEDAEVFARRRITENNDIITDFQTDGLMEKILHKDNLNKAYKKVKSNKGAGGVDGMSVDELLGFLRDNQKQLIQKMKDGKYKPNPVRRVEIPKEIKGEFRKLGVPTVVDRVFQQAITQVLALIYEEQFSENSYGFRPNRGTHDLEEILDYIGEIPFQQLDVKNLEARKQKKLEEVEKCKRLKTSLYEDMKDGILTKEEYLELHEAYLEKAKEGEEIIRQIERDIALILEEKDDKHLWMNYFTEYKDIKELTRDVVVKLISEVRVSENKEIEIVFDFDDCYKQLLESVEKLGYQVDKEPGGQLNISRKE